jgi:hypothetical protein
MFICIIYIMPRQKQINKKQQTHGKAESKSKEQTIHELMETKAINPYGTSDPDKFESELSQMSKFDLQNLSVKLGIVPRGSQAAMRGAIARSFKKYTGQSFGKKGQQAAKLNGPLVSPETDSAKRIQKLLGN